MALTPKTCDTFVGVATETVTNQASKPLAGNMQTVDQHILDKSLHITNYEHLPEAIHDGQPGNFWI